MSNNLAKKTSLYDQHRAESATMTEFAGYDMPLHYGSQIGEHHAVRQDAGMFDVSHMGIIDIIGTNSREFLKILLANDIDKLKAPGKALYSCMLNPTGGILDDLIAYFIAKDYYRLVVNAATKDKDLQWIQKQLTSDPSFQGIAVHRRDELALIAVQGPRARAKAAQAMVNYQEKILALKPFNFISSVEDGTCSWLIARTGYTGEDGIEIMLPQSEAPALWKKFLAAGIPPAGLGARDTLRLEAGLNLYGQDMDESVTPLESNLGWTVAFEPKERQFIGRNPLDRQKQEGLKKRLIGLELQEKGVLRHDQIVFLQDKPIGRVTSGSFSPTLSRAIALASLDESENAFTLNQECAVAIRGKMIKAKLVQPPFVRRST